jgi:ribose transport system permease protein
MANIFQLNLKKIAQKWAIGIVLLILILLFSFLGRNFFSRQNMFIIMSQVSLVGIASCGMLFVLLIGGIDLAMGGEITFVNVFLAYLIINIKLPVPAAVMVVFLYAILHGWIVGLLVTKIKIPPFIATLGFMKILQGAAYLLCNGMPIFGFPKGFTFLGQGYVLGIPVSVLVMAACFLVAGIILNYSYLGRNFMAIGCNEEVAKLSGINVDRHKILVYIISTVFCALSGIVTLSRLNSGAPQTGNGFEFNVIIACVVGGVSLSGGMATITGTVIGVFVMGVLINGMALMNMNSYKQNVVTGVVLVCAVCFDCIQKTMATRLNRSEAQQILNAADKEAAEN